VLYTSSMGEGIALHTADTQLFRDVFNASPIGIAVETLEGQPLFLNPAFCSMLGFSEEELRSKHCVDFSPPEDAEKDWELFQQLRAGSIGHYQLEKRYFRRDGSLVWGRLSVSLLNRGSSPLVLAMVENITEQKKLEEARFRHAAIVESSEDAIASVTLDGVIASWNAGAQRMFGYTEAEAVGKPVTMLVPPDLPDQESTILETLRAGSYIKQLETVRLTKAGKRIDVSLSISPIKDSSGAVVGFSGISRDITERKRSEEALRCSEERLRLAQQAGHIGTFDWNLQTGENTWTGELEAMYGLPPGGFGGTYAAFENLVHPDDRVPVNELVSESLKTEQPTHGEWRVIWPDGSVHWIAGRWQIFANRSREPLRVIGVNIDITQSKQAEQALRDSEQRFHLATEAGRMYSFEWNVTTGAVVRSSEHLQVLGVTEPLGFSHQQFVEKIHPDDRPKFWATVAGLTPEKPTAAVTYRVMLSDCAIVWLRSSGRAYFDGNGRMLRVIGMIADITDLKRSEEALSRMTRKLIEAQEQERARIGRELHDDINQRLALLPMELEQLKENPSEIEARVQELQRTVGDISNDVQALSHDLDSSKLEYLGAVAGIRSWCREFSERQKMQVDFKSAVPGVLPLEIGRSLLRILQEALHNASKHSGVRRVEVYLGEDSGEIHLIVSDSGRGFEIEAALQGKGLGLTSMRERVRLVNGTIAIDSKPLGGTSIHVRVPLDSGQGAQREAV